MLRLLGRWPPLTWLVVYVGSLFVLMGSQRADLLVIELSANSDRVRTGAPALARVFGAMMDVELVTDGPVTLLIEI